MVFLRNIVLISMVFIVEYSIAQPCGEIIWNKKNKNKLHAKYEFVSDTSILKYNGVYIQEYNHDSVTWYYFKRFYPNGTVISSQRYCYYPNQQDRNNLKDGNKGYYFVKDKLIIIQEYNSHEGYYYSYLSLSKNKIQYDYTLKKLNSKRKKDSIYKTVYTFVPD